MKRLLVLMLALCLAVGLCSAAFAENEKAETPEQGVYGILEEQMTGEAVYVAIDLKDGWSAGFYPAAFYLYDTAEAFAEDETIAFGTTLSEESYASLLEAQEDSKREDKDGYTVFTEEEGAMVFVAQAMPGAEAEADKDEQEEPATVYVMLRVYDAENGEDAWSRVSYELAGFNLKLPAQVASGVIADAMNTDVLVKVSLDVSEGWSTRFLPMAFYMIAPGEEDGDNIYGTLLNKESYDDVVKSHTEDKTLEEKDGYLMYTADGYAGILAPVPDSEDEYITLIAYEPIDVESIWELVSFELF